MDKARYLYSALASAVQARKTCQERQNGEWFDTWSKEINNLVERFMPHGSGVDCGTKIDLDASHAEKLVFYASFHHMNENGFYDGWTEHTITVTPSFTGINLRISGRNRNEIKEYLYETFDCALSQEITDEQILESRK